MTNYKNAPQLRQAGATDAIIHSAPHTSKSEGGRPHATYNVYDKAGQLTHGGHAPGQLFTPQDPNYIQRWSNIGNTNPSAARQEQRNCGYLTCQ
ncbi:hypothetical protein K474DRAFT_1668481 [Panus rudis PR-1116 ss-1]|nr:hypothetical protein K474DRAFT_1668481 [Panus rudis PR-1116 ss-1]